MAALQLPMSEQPAVRLCLLLESTAAMVPHWSELRALYIEPMLRQLEEGKMGAYELSLIVFRSRASTYSQNVVDRSEWLPSAAELRSLLDSFAPRGGGQFDIALAEALAEAIFVLSRPCALAAPKAVHDHVLVAMVSQPHRLGVVWPYAVECKASDASCLANYQDLFSCLNSRSIHLSVVTRRLSAWLLSTYMSHVAQLRMAAQPAASVDMKALKQELCMHWVVQHNKYLMCCAPALGPGLPSLLKAGDGGRQPAGAAPVLPHAQPAQNESGSTAGAAAAHVPQTSAMAPHAGGAHSANSAQERSAKRTKSASSPGAGLLPPYHNALTPQTQHALSPQAVQVLSPPAAAPAALTGLMKASPPGVAGQGGYPQGAPSPSAQAGLQMQQQATMQRMMSPPGQQLSPQQQAAGWLQPVARQLSAGAQQVAAPPACLPQGQLMTQVRSSLLPQGQLMTQVRSSLLPQGQLMTQAKVDALAQQSHLLRQHMQAQQQAQAQQQMQQAQQRLVQQQQQMPVQQMRQQQQQQTLAGQNAAAIAQHSAAAGPLQQQTGGGSYTNPGGAPMPLPHQLAVTAANISGELPVDASMPLCWAGTVLFGARTLAKFGFNNAMPVFDARAFVKAHATPQLGANWPGQVVVERFVAAQDYLKQHQHLLQGSPTPRLSIQVTNLYQNGKTLLNEIFNRKYAMLAPLGDRQLFVVVQGPSGESFRISGLVMPLPPHST